MIELEQVSISLGKFNLRDVNLRISKGEYHILLGPSGAGKTVLLETIAGLRFPDSGKILLGGIDTSGTPPENRHIAIVYQDYSLFPHMTAFENIAFGLRLRQIAEAEIQQRVRFLLNEFNITSLIDQYPSSMSGGEQQRVAIARALATDPSVLLLDEPFASLDPRSCEECVRVIQDLKDTRSITILQVSHSGDEAYALADKVSVLIGGKVEQSGTPDVIFSHPASVEVARFTGMENVLAGTVTCDGSGHSWISIGSSIIPLPHTFQDGARISIGIPAGCIRVVPEQLISDDQGMNCIPCQVNRVIWRKDTATIKLEGQINLTAVMWRKDNDHQIPLTGTHVYAVFKNTDVRVISGA